MPRNAYADYILDLLHDFGPLTTRPMFGAVGLYRHGVFFGFVDDDAVYFKTDETTREEYRAVGSAPFVYHAHGKTMEMSYWRVPEEVLEDSDTLMAFANKALDVARAKAKAPKKKADTKPAKKTATKKKPRASKPTRKSSRR